MKSILKISLLITVPFLLHAQEPVNQLALAYTKVDALLKSGYNKQARHVLDSLSTNKEIYASAIYNFYKARASDNDTVSILICKTVIPTLNLLDTLTDDFYALLAGNFILLQQFDSALLYNSKAIDLNRNEITYHLNQSYITGEMGDYKSCLKSLEEAHFLDPNDYHILNNMAYYSSMNRDFSKAIDYSNDGLKLNPDSQQLGLLLNNRAFANIGLKNYEVALKDIDQSLIYFPKNSYAYYNKALAYIELKDFEKACFNLQQAKNFGGLNMTKDLIAQYCK